jgi:outer membrane protein assembly factor BamB
MRTLAIPLRILFFAFSAAASFAEWANWRGPNQSGVAEAKGLPAEWSATRNIAWKTAIPGRGHSSPVVWGNRVFLTTAMEGADVLPDVKPVRHKLGPQDPFIHPQSVGADRKYTLKVLAIDAETGRIIWERTAYEGTVYDQRHQKNTYATPTPATDGKHIYVSFESQGVYCYDFDGRLVWKASVGGIATLGMGPGTSPVLVDNVVVVLCDQDEGRDSFLIALSKADGKVVWKTKRNIAVTWTTPLPVRVDGKMQLIVSGGRAVAAYDTKSGEELWRAPGLEGTVVNSPVAGAGLVFATVGFPNKLVLALRPEGGERVAWRYEKGTAYVPSAIVYGEYLYILTDAGLITCLEAKSGKVVYEGKRLPDPGRVSASPVAFDGKLLLVSEDGDAYVIRAGPEFAVQAKNSLEEPVFASPAICGRAIYLRGATHLYRIERR